MTMSTQKVTLDCGYTIEFFEKSEFIYKEIWEDGYYDHDFQIQSGSVVVDFGANQGFFSLYAASKGASVFSVEPDKDNFQLLARNISANGLGKQVIAYNYAISKQEGEIELFVPKTDELCATGLITTNKEVNLSFSKLNVAHVEKSTIQGVSLKTFLKEIRQPKIDLLKIDCEGAELDIMQSGDSADFARIENIVMETHAAYLEKDLFHCVKSLGFNIVSYTKLDGAFCTGYLFCSRNSALASKIIRDPVAILKAPSYATVGDSITLDATESFSTENSDKVLEYRWDIDGAAPPEPLATVTPKTIGPHKATVTVTDEGRSDSSTTNFWIFSQDYAPMEQAAPIGKLSEIYTGTFCTRQNFVLSEKNIPKTWNYKAIALAVTLKCQGTLAEAGVALEFDGQRTPVSEYYQVFRFPYFPNSCDLHFSLTSLQTVDLEIRWCVEEEEESKITERVSCPATGVVEMGKKAKALVCELQRSTEFVIKQNQFPRQWSRIKVCLSAHTSDPSGYLLTGEISINGTQHPLSSAYKEFVLREKAPESDLQFSISVPQERIYQLTWWPE